MSDHGNHGEEEVSAAPFIYCSGLTTDERRELAELRRENRRLREDVEILKRAAASSPSHRQHIFVVWTGLQGTSA